MLTPQGPQDIESLDSVQRLLSSGLTEDWRESDGFGLFHLVTMCGNDDAIRFLTSRGWNADIRVRSSHNSAFEDLSPVHLAAFCGRIKCLKALLDNRSYANSTTKFGIAPLHLACGNSSVAEVLLVMGADPNARDREGETPFVFACGAANPGQIAEDRILNLMLEKGAITTVANSKGLTPLHLAADAGEDRWVTYFLDCGIDVNTKTTFGEVPLHRAARFDHDSVCSILVKAGAEINATNAKGETPLSIALKRNSMNAAKVLLDHGAIGAMATPRKKPAEMHISWDDALLAFERRRSEPCLEVVRALIVAGADVNARDAQGITPLHICFLPNYFGELGADLFAKFGDIL